MPYIYFNRDDWKSLRMATPLPITENDLNKIQGINENIQLEEVVQVYLPISRLLNLYITAARNLYDVTHIFLGTLPEKVPYIIGIAGSVAVGKSTTARLIKTLLENWPNRPNVDLVTTDGFLYPNEILEQRGLMQKKGFPESYDLNRLMEFLKLIKSGCSEIAVPEYSHSSYNIVPNQFQIVSHPDIIILEGINVLQPSLSPSMCISDFLDFSIYIHADEQIIKQWYIERFLILSKTVFQDKNSRFHQYANLPQNDIISLAEKFWNEINGPNLRNNIYPIMKRASLILEKGNGHVIEKILLRKL